MRAALRREAEIALRLRHPNVVRLRGIELEDEVPVLVMDYVEGTTLADLVRDWLKHDRKDTARGALRIILDAAEGLHALHELRGERGEPLALVHRDVSPQNVLVGLDGRARVSDFGLTKCLATDRATTEGVLKGKAGYLAPEYIRGERGDRRQDVFSLAIVAWEALTKSRLFRGENEAQTLDFVLTMEIPSITTKAPELVDAATKIDPVLQRALARDPQDRYESALAFGQALTEAAMASGLLGTDADVRAGFSPGLATELGARRVALGREERARNNRFIASAVLATGMFALATALVVRPRTPRSRHRQRPRRPRRRRTSNQPLRWKSCRCRTRRRPRRDTESIARSRDRARSQRRPPNRTASRDRIHIERSLDGPNLA